jgi:hypothetical protein
MSRQKHNFYNIFSTFLHEDSSLLGCYAVSNDKESTFWLLDPEGTTLLRNVGNYLPVDKAYHHITLESSSSSSSSQLWYSPIPHLLSSCLAYRSASTYLLLSVIKFLPAVFTTPQHASCKYYSKLSNTPLQSYAHKLWRYYFVKVVD